MQCFAYVLFVYLPDKRQQGKSFTKIKLQTLCNLPSEECKTHDIIAYVTGIEKSWFVSVVSF